MPSDQSCGRQPNDHLRMYWWRYLVARLRGLISRSVDGRPRTARAVTSKRGAQKIRRAENIRCRQMALMDRAAYSNVWPGRLAPTTVRGRAVSVGRSQTRPVSVGRFRVPVRHHHRTYAERLSCTITVDRTLPGTRTCRDTHIPELGALLRHILDLGERYGPWSYSELVLLTPVE